MPKDKEENAILVLWKLSIHDAFPSSKNVEVDIIELCPFFSDNLESTRVL